MRLWRSIQHMFWPIVIVGSLVFFNSIFQHSYPPEIPMYESFIWQLVRPLYLTYAHGSTMHFLANTLTTSILAFTISIFVRIKYVSIIILCGYLTSYVYIYMYGGIGFSIISYFIQGALTILVCILIYTEITHIITHTYSLKQKTIMLSFMCCISSLILFIVFIFANEVLIAFQYIPTNSSLFIDIPYPNGYSIHSAKSHTVGYILGTIVMIPIIQFTPYANIEL